MNAEMRRLPGIIAQSFPAIILPQRRLWTHPFAGSIRTTQYRWSLEAIARRADSNPEQPDQSSARSATRTWRRLRELD